MPAMNSMSIKTAAHILSVQGSVLKITSKAVALPAKPNDRVLNNEILLTSESDARTTLSLTGGYRVELGGLTQLGLGPQRELQTDTHELSALDLVYGNVVMAYDDGAAICPNAIIVNTPVCSVYLWQAGAWIRVLRHGETYVELMSGREGFVGRIEMESRAGTLILKQELMGGRVDSVGGLPIPLNRFNQSHSSYFLERVPSDL